MLRTECASRHIKQRGAARRGGKVHRCGLRHLFTPVRYAPFPACFCQCACAATAPARVRPPNAARAIYGFPSLIALFHLLQWPVSARFSAAWPWEGYSLIDGRHRYTCLMSRASTGAQLVPQLWWWLSITTSSHLSVICSRPLFSFEICQLPATEVCGVKPLRSLKRVRKVMQLSFPRKY